jgi:hypothetical protein
MLSGVCVSILPISRRSQRSKCTMALSQEVILKVNKEFNELPTIESQLPIRLVNGATVNEFTGKCLKCHTEIEQSNFRGRIRSAVGNSYRITGYGWCAGCNLITPFNYHVLPKDNGFDMVTLKYRTPTLESAKIVPLKG